MKTLYESILDDEDEVMDRIGTSVTIEQFLQENYNLKNCTYTIKDNVVNVDGLIGIKPRKAKELTQLTNGHFKFGTVDAFYCNDCRNLKSLEGGPEKVSGSFDCSETPIKDLTGAPEEVGEVFSCCDSPNLISLKGAPRKAKHFDCSGTAITDLVGAPELIEDSLDCSWCDNLISLKGIPNKEFKFLFAQGCKKLKSLKYCPKHLGNYIKISMSEKDLIKELKNNNINFNRIQLGSSGPNSYNNVIFK